MIKTQDSFTVKGNAVIGKQTDKLAPNLIMDVSAKGYQKSLTKRIGFLFSQTQ